MRKMYSLFMIIIFLMMGCSNNSFKKETRPEYEKDKKLLVGFSQMENNGPWRIAETNSIKNEAKKRNIELIFTDAEGDVKKQISDVQYLIEQKVDYIILAPKTYNELGEALQLSKAAGIPVILLDRKAKGEPGKDYLTLIRSDFIWEARQAGKLLVEATNEKANIVELRGTVGSSVAIDRSKGFNEVIDQYEDMSIITSQSADFSRAEGKKVMEKIIRSSEKTITAVYAHNDEMAIGAIIALKAAGIEPGEDVIVISIDGEKDALKAIIAGDLYATIECSPFFGPITFDIIERHLAGEKIDPLIINKDRIFTKENAIRYVDDAF
ncbi:MAG: rbsB, ribose transport system substrate-binding protein [Clostridia bacterium]|nr:rbsB, ribose transport system substrate-binding protein [Clostridia bacterium]